MNGLRFLLELFRLLPSLWFLLLLLVSLVSGLSGLGLLGASAWLVSHAALQPPLYTLSLAITFVRACGIGRAAARYLERLLSHRLAFRAMESLQLFLYRQAAREIPLREGAARQSRWIEELMQGTAVLRELYLRWLLPVSGTLLLTLCFAGWIFPAMPEIAVFVIALWIVQLLLPHALRKRDSETGEVYRLALEDFSAGRDELLTAGSLPMAERRLDALALRHASERRSSGDRTDDGEVLLELCRQAVFLVIFFCLGERVAEGRLPGTELSVLLLMTHALLMEYKPLAAAAQQLRVSLKHLPAVFSGKSSEEVFLRDGAGAAAGVGSSSGVPLEAQGLTFSYREGIPVFEPLSFTVRSGEAVAILGESGAGKTTLACLLLGFWKPDAGTLRWFGETAYSLSEDDIRGCFSSALQGCYIFSSSVRDNFTRLHPDISDQEIWRALEEAGLAGFIRALPGGLDASPGMGGSRFSGGQRARLFTALALAGDTPVLLLDEPMNGLDASTAEALLASLLQHVEERGQTLLLITHDVETIKKLPLRLMLRPAPVREREISV